MENSPQNSYDYPIFQSSGLNQGLAETRLKRSR